EAGGRMVEVVDRVLQFLEETLLVVALGGDVGELPDLQRLALAAASRQQPRLQAIPMRAGAAWTRPQRTKKAKLFGALAAFAQAVRQAKERFVGLAVARQQCFERLHLRRLGGAGQFAVGGIGIDDASLAVGNQRAVGLAVEESARQVVRL